MGLTSSKYDPCLLSGIIDNGTPPTTPRHPVHVGLYVEHIIFFSESDTEESRFKKLLNKQFSTNFMEGTYFCLGSSFE